MLNPVNCSRFQAIFLFLFCLLNLPSYSQVEDKIILEKLGRRKRITYYLSDPIILKLKGDPEEFAGVVSEIYDHGFMVDDIYVPLDSIKYIKTKHTNGFFSPSNGPKLIIAGIGLFLIDQLNHSVIRGQDFRVPEDIAIVSGSLVGFGIFWTSLKYRKFKPGPNRRIRTFVE